MPSNKAQQNATELSDKQTLALSAIVAGRSITDAAIDAGVDRSTVHRWLKEDDFAAELNRARSALRTELNACLWNLAKTALSALSNGIEGGDTRAAFEVCRSLGLLEPRGLAVGPETAAALKMKREEDQKLRDLLIRAVPS